MAKEWDGTRSPFDAVQVRTDGFRDCIDAIKGAIALGQQGVSPAPEGHWLAEFWEIGRKLAASPADQVSKRDVKILLDWIEEAVEYVGCKTWSPSLERDGRKILSKMSATPPAAESQD